MEVKDQTHLPCLALWQEYGRDAVADYSKVKTQNASVTSFAIMKGHVCLYSITFHYIDAPTRPTVPLKSALLENNEVTHLNISTLLYALYTLHFLG